VHPESYSLALKLAHEALQARGELRESTVRELMDNPAKLDELGTPRRRVWLWLELRKRVYDCGCDYSSCEVCLAS
jgi:hypothetical protein